MGVSLSTVNRAHMAYDQGGLKALKIQAEWRAQAREHDVGSQGHRRQDRRGIPDNRWTLRKN
jgi:hypothetical protein